MFARVMTSTVKPQSIDAAVAEWPTHISVFKGKGLIAGYLFLDRNTSQFLSITVWESEDAQRRNSTSPEQIHGRSEFSKHLTGTPVPSTFEVVATVA
jgi:heme-degrading monooxygenase HmoA